MKCPECGGNVDLTGQQGKIRCPYCGTSIISSGNTQNTSYNIFISSEKPGNNVSDSTVFGTNPLSTEELENKHAIADEAFIAESFYEARETYLSILSYRPDDMIALCRTVISTYRLHEDPDFSQFRNSLHNLYVIRSEIIRQLPSMTQETVDHYNHVFYVAGADLLNFMHYLVTEKGKISIPAKSSQECLQQLTMWCSLLDIFTRCFLIIPDGPEKEKYFDILAEYAENVRKTAGNLTYYDRMNRLIAHYNMSTEMEKLINEKCDNFIAAYNKQPFHLRRCRDPEQKAAALRDEIPRLKQQCRKDDIDYNAARSEFRENTGRLIRNITIAVSVLISLIISGYSLTFDNIYDSLAFYVIFFCCVISGEILLTRLLDTILASPEMISIKKSAKENRKKLQETIKEMNETEKRIWQIKKSQTAAENNSP